MFKRLTFLLLVGLLAWAYQAIQPPPPKLCGSPGGPLVTASRIKLRDGRYLAYKEYGVPKEVARYKIIYVHAFGSTRHDALIATTVPQVRNLFLKREKQQRWYFVVLQPILKSKRCAEVEDEASKAFKQTGYLL